MELDTPEKISILLTSCFYRKCCVFQALATVKSNINLSTKWHLFGHIFTRSGKVKS